MLKLLERASVKNFNDRINNIKQDIALNKEQNVYLFINLLSSKRCIVAIFKRNHHRKSMKHS